MRTTLVIDDDLLAEAMRAIGARTKRDAVEQGLRTLVRLSRQRDIRCLRGQLSWSGDLDAMRAER